MLRILFSARNRFLRLTATGEKVCASLDELLRVIDEMLGVFSKEFKSSIAQHLTCRGYNPAFGLDAIEPLTVCFL
jgi:DNA-binding MarR family transcriptional regulator